MDIPTRYNCNDDSSDSSGFNSLVSDVEVASSPTHLIMKSEEDTEVNVALNYESRRTRRSEFELHEAEIMNVADYAWKLAYQKKITRLEFELQAYKFHVQTMEQQFAKKKEELEKKHEEQMELEMKYNNVLYELGRLEFQKANEENAKRNEVRFQQIYFRNRASNNAENTNEFVTPAPLEKSGHYNLVPQDQRRMFYNAKNANNEQPDLEDRDANGSLSDRNEADNHCLHLLDIIAYSLLSEDVLKLKSWACEKFEINRPRNAKDILDQLHQREIITSADLSVIREFFESINRIDLVYTIDEFLLANYTVLQVYNLATG